MPGWNCRMVELNAVAVNCAWKPIDAHNAQRAAVAYCNDASVWEDAQWANGFDAIVEVEKFGGEDGTHRMVICAYDRLDFSATPEGEA
jgi:hypothetical protein